MHEGLRYKWPGPDEKQIVAQMLDDPNSDHWNECRSFCEKVVQLSGLPAEMHEDVVQNSLFSVIRNLSGFRFESKLSTWLVRVVRSRITDARRDLMRMGGTVSIQDKPSDDDEENEKSVYSIEERHTTEDICIIHENIFEVKRILREFLDSHAHPERNKQILQRVLFEGRTVKDVAKELGISDPNIRYTIHAFQRYLYERFDKQDPPDELNS